MLEAHSSPPADRRAPRDPARTRRAILQMAFDTRPSEPCALIAYESFDRADTSPSLSAIRQSSASEAALTFRIMLLR